MIHERLFIGRWRVDFLFSLDGYDRDEILKFLDSLDADYEAVSGIERMIERQAENTGFIYTDSYLMRALVVIGPSSSGAEFIDTLVHEIHHLAVAIADRLGISLDGETPAYLSGDAARDLATIICKLGCGRL